MLDGKNRKLKELWTVEKQRVGKHKEEKVTARKKTIYHNFQADDESTVELRSKGKKIRLEIYISHIFILAISISILKKFYWIILIIPRYIMEQSLTVLQFNCIAASVSFLRARAHARTHARTHAHAHAHARTHERTSAHARTHV